MVKFINAYTGSVTWVADDRIDEYKAAGHKLAAKERETSKTEDVPEEKPEAKPVKKTAAKAKK